MNRRLLLLAPLLFALPALAADEPEKDSPQKIVDDVNTEFTALEKTVSSITDEASAKTASPALEKHVDALIALVARMEKFPDPPADVLKKFAAVVNKISQNIDTALRDLHKKDPAASKVIDAVMRKLGENQPPESWMKALQPHEPPDPAPAPAPAETMPK